MNKIVNPFATVCLVLVFPTSKKVGDNVQDIVVVDMMLSLR